ncbi:MAG: UDP-N-acetylmuramoyl-tripeptide--D-alanyl-D-alanine ligase [Candidatus Moranbacteria bacterium]|nr:UDP-N-acetylmuramoyl-tripeptide--D-alanyl-D-alanine ligase [Candidatus Moranbacteria bacterium]
MNKNNLKKWLQKMLKIMAVLVLKKYNPKIISVTGSVGKTSTKEAIFAVVASRFRVRRNEKNYNNEIGIPLTIIGVYSGQNSVCRWCWVFLKWLAVIIFPTEYPEVLILEMGADRPGDIKYLTGFINSNIGVITDVSPSHIEFFKNIEAIAAEKGILIQKLEEGNLAVLCSDNPSVIKMQESAKAGVITYGFSEKAQMRATDISFIYDGGQVRGLSFKLNYNGTSLPVRLGNIIAKHHIYAALAAAAVGIGLKINLVDAAAALENFTLPQGRMNLLEGIKNSMVIDDTYNSSPKATAFALETLKEIEAVRKIAVLGDMLELGEETEKDHEELGREFLENKIDIFLAVGRRMKSAADYLEKHGLSGENIFSFDNPTEAGKKLAEILKEGDLILVKGSQGMRMEKTVEEIIAEPQKISELLCRQNKEWKAIPFKEV